MSLAVFTLFVSGHSLASEMSVTAMRSMCEDLLPSRYELEIVDVLVNPQRAEDENILAIPTLIREVPLPRRRILGDLSDLKRVLSALGLDHEYIKGGW